MAIALGSTFNDPWFLALQIVCMYSVYYLSLGVSLILTHFVSTAILSPTLVVLSSPSPAASTSLFHWPWMRPFQLTLPDLLGTEPDQPGAHVATGWELVLAHQLGAAVLAFIMSHVVERQKFVLDFVITLSALSIITTWIGGGFPMWKWWWAAVTSSQVLLYFLAIRWCRLREMQEIELGPSDGEVAGSTTLTVVIGTGKSPGAASRLSTIDQGPPGSASKQRKK